MTDPPAVLAWADVDHACHGYLAVVTMPTGKATGRILAPAPGIRPEFQQKRWGTFFAWFVTPAPTAKVVLIQEPPWRTPTRSPRDD